MSSLWNSKITNNYNKIDSNYTSDVCIIGAGICGLSTAYYLSKKGLKVIIVDKNKIGDKVSGNSTAKITFQHNLFYDYLIKNFGIDTASAYLESNQKAISNIKKIIDAENIDCNFEYTDNFVYTTNQDEISSIHNEIKALNILIKNISSSSQENSASHLLKNQNTFPQFVTKCGLPFKITGACKISNQAQLNPVKYMLGLAKSITENGGIIFTNSTVSDVKYNADYFNVEQISNKNSSQLETGLYTTYINDYTVTSKFIVLASHFPFLNFPGMHFLKMYQSTSYAIAIETNKKLFDGMYINPKEPIFSFRTANYENKKILIIAGGDHKTGFNPDNTNGYQILEQKIKELYPDYKILYKWNTHDCITLDKIPYIGDFSNFMPNMYVATGFKKWGMTLSNVAANIISDKILGKENKYEFVYNATRINPIKNKEEMSNIVSQTFKSFVSNRIKIPKEDLSVIKNNNGGIIKINGASVGIYKDKDGNIFAVNPTCSHLGCLLTWNNLDKTWDCPCHGSRFDYSGKNIYDPAFKNLKTYNLE